MIRTLAGVALALCVASSHASVLLCQAWCRSHTSRATVAQADHAGHSCADAAAAAAPVAPAALTAPEQGRQLFAQSHVCDHPSTGAAWYDRASRQLGTALLPPVPVVPGLRQTIARATAVALPPPLPDRLDRPLPLRI